MRPTIPLSHWRIAVDVSATRAILDLPGRPAGGCTCPWCRNWALVQGSVLPDQLVRELLRLGVDPARPTDLYAFGETPNRIAYRVTYHCIGQILGGPAVSVANERLGAMRNYVALRPGPNELTLSVAYQDALHDPASWYVPGEGGKLIQVDFRLDVPWQLPETRPPTTTR